MIVVVGDNSVRWNTMIVTTDIDSVRWSTMIMCGAPPNTIRHIVEQTSKMYAMNAMSRR